MGFGQAVVLNTIVVQNEGQRETTGKENEGKRLEKKIEIERQKRFHSKTTHRNTELFSLSTKVFFLKNHPQKSGERRVPTHIRNKALDR